MKLQQKELRKTFTSTINEWRLYIETFLKWLVIASLIGGAGGLLGAIFHHSIEMVEKFRSTHPWLLWLLPIAGLLIVGFYKMTKTEGLNTNHVIRAVHKGKKLSVMLAGDFFRNRTDAAVRRQRGTRRCCSSNGRHNRSVDRTRTALG